MKNRSRTAARVTGVVAAGALLFGVVGPAGAAVQDVEYTVVPNEATITIPTGDGPLVFTLPDATGITGTWDDATGDFDADFTSAEYTVTRAVTAPIAGDITQRVQFTAPAGVTGNIDPATGTGTLNATFNINIVLESILITGQPTPTTLDFICTITGATVAYAATATGQGGSSVIPTNLALTASGINVPAATCVAGPQGNPQLLPTIQQGLNDALDLPNAAVSSAINMVAGAVPPPPSTTTTTIPPTTTTTSTTAPAGADTATPVRTNARFTG